MKNQIVTIILLMTLFTSFVSALTATQDSLDVSVIPEFNQPGKVTLTISDADPGNYNVYTLTAVKILPTEPFLLNSGKNKVELEVYPTENLKATESQRYTFSYSIRNTETKEDFEDQISVRVVSVQNALEISSDSNSPDSEKITFYIKNKEEIDLKNIEVSFNSIFFDFSEKFDLDANSKKEFSIPVDKDKLSKIEAGSYIVKSEIKTDRGVKELEGRVVLGEKKGIEVKETTSGVIIRTTEISKINYGNVNEIVSVNVERNILSRLFTSFNIQPDITTRNGFKISYSWSKKLGPSDSFKVEARTNYIYPVLAIIAIVLIVLGFKRYSDTKVEIKKSVVPIKTADGKFALRVRLNILAKRRIENVSVIDRIPGLVQVHEKFDSLFKPTKIDLKNRRIQWDLGELSAGDERLLSYIIYSKIGVVGKFSLPKALAVFESRGNIQEISSNAVFFLAEQQMKEEN